MPSLVTSRRPALGFIFITLVLDILGIGIIVPVLPKLVEHFKGGSVEAAAHTLGFLSALYALMQFLFAPVLGSLSDKVGRRPVILFSLFGSGVDYFFLAFAPSLAWFFVGRMISGITGSSFSAATAYIADVSPPEKRAANFGLVGAAFGLGFILGPLIGGILGQYGLHVPFVVAGCLTLANWLYGLLVLPESLKPENRRAFSLARANPVGSLLDLKRFPAVLGLALTHFLICLAHQVLPSTWVLYTSYRYHWSELQTGVSLAFVGFMAAMVQGGLNRVAVKRLGEAKSASIGLLVATAAYALYGFATEGWMVYVIIFFGSAAGLTGPAIQGLISRSVGADVQGEVQGTMTSLQSLAAIFGPILATGLFGYFISDEVTIKIPGIAFFVSAGISVLSLLIATRYFKRMPPQATMPSAMEGAEQEAEPA